MKTRFLSMVLFCTLLSVAAFSQSVKFGVKAGTDLQKIKGKSFDEEFKFGYHAGAYVEIKVKNIGIQPELYFSQVNSQLGSDTASIFSIKNITKAKLSYLNIPILVNLYFGPNVALQLGPQFGVLVNQDISGPNNVNNAFKSGDFSLTGGLQLNISKFRLYGRYVIGLNDKNNLGDVSSQEKWRSQTVHLGIGYTIL